MLSIGAFNALLKTLEEPPAHVKFILATTEVHKLPATILSRCQRFDFHRITPENISSRLNYVAECENIELDDDASVLIARIADGAMRDALSILDRCSGITNHVTSEVVSNAAGLAGKDYLFDLVENINENNPSEVLSIVAKLHNDSCDMERLCTELINHYRNMMIIKTVKNPQKLIVCTDIDFELYKKQAEKTTLFKVLSCISTLEECSSMLKSSSNKRTEMEMSVVKLCIPDLSDDNTAILERIERLENMLKDGKVVVSEKTEAKREEKPDPTPAPVQKEEKKEEIPLPPPPTEPEKTLDTYTPSDVSVLFTSWGEVLEKLNVTDKPLLGILGTTSSAYVRGEFILIKCDNPVFSEFIRQGNHANAIKIAAYEVTGKKFRLGIYKSDEKKTNTNDPLADLVNKINNL